MTDVNDTRDMQTLGARLVSLCEAYEALGTLMDGCQPQYSVLAVLNADLRAALDDADRLGLVP